MNGNNEINTLIKYFSIGWENDINVVFILAIGLLALIELIFFLIKKKIDFKSQIVSLGVLGTFVGVYVGLQSFDAHHLKESIGSILDGLKIAFFTSIVGMSVAIALYFIERILQIFQVWRDSDEEIDILRNIEVYIKKLDNDKVIAELERMRSVQNDQRSILEKLIDLQERSFEELNELMREGFEKMNHSLEIAIEKLSKGATEEIIKALKEVIENFNQELQTQFGENFIKLNEAVLNLLQWQENYKEQVSKNENMLNAIVRVLENTEKSISNIHHNLENINDLYKKMEEVITVMNNQIKILEHHLDTFAEIGNQAKDSFEIIHQAVDTIEKRFGTMTEEITTHIKQQQKELSEHVKMISEITISEIEKNIEKLNIITEHFRKMGEEIPKALEISLDNLNKGLASLTNKFKDDYNEVLQSAKENLAKV